MQQENNFRPSMIWNAAFWKNGIQFHKIGEW